VPGCDGLCGLAVSVFSSLLIPDGLLLRIRDVQANGQARGLWCRGQVVDTKIINIKTVQTCCPIVAALTEDRRLAWGAKCRNIRDTFAPLWPTGARKFRVAPL